MSKQIKGTKLTKQMEKKSKNKMYPDTLDMFNDFINDHNETTANKIRLTKEFDEKFKSKYPNAKNLFDFEKENNIKWKFAWHLPATSYSNYDNISITAFEYQDDIYTYRLSIYDISFRFSHEDYIKRLLSCSNWNVNLDVFTTK